VDSELETTPVVPDPERTRQTEIHGERSRSDDGVAAGIAECTRLRNGECQWIEIPRATIDGNPSGICTAATDGSSATGVRLIAKDACSEWAAGARSDRAANRPVLKQAIGPAVVAVQYPVLSEGRG